MMVIMTDYCPCFLQFFFLSSPYSFILCQLSDLILAHFLSLFSYTIQTSHGYYHYCFYHEKRLFIADVISFFIVIPIICISLERRIGPALLLARLAPSLNPDSPLTATLELSTTQDLDHRCSWT